MTSHYLRLGARPASTNFNPLWAVHTYATLRFLARCCAALVETLLMFLLAQRSAAQRMCERPFIYSFISPSHIVAENK